MGLCGSKEDVTNNQQQQNATNSKKPNAIPNQKQRQRQTHIKDTTINTIANNSQKNNNNNNNNNNKVATVAGPPTTTKLVTKITKKSPSQIEQENKIEKSKINSYKKNASSSSSSSSDKETKVLLLGAGESGKSTILQQLKILHGSGFSHDELLEFIPIIYNNLLEIGNDLIIAREKFNIPIESSSSSSVTLIDIEKFKEFALEPDNGTDEDEDEDDDDENDDEDEDKNDKHTKEEEDNIEIRSNSNDDDDDDNNNNNDPKKQKTRIKMISEFPMEIANFLKALWNLKTTQDLIKSNHRSDFYLMDSGQYFMKNLDRIVQPGYIPNVQDILRSRHKTSGIFDLRINMTSNLKLHLFDVGGQRSERKKWIHCFDNVTLIIYCISLSEYDQFLIEDSSQNRFQESLILFENIINSRWFARTSVILFLNKIDLFAEKLKKIPLETYFPDYTGGQDINKATKYILWRFMQLNRANLTIYPHVTQATDTSNVKLVFAAIKETILENSLKDTGVL
ncbi:guanine nucleotide-binding protein subunit alpha NDAI_0J00490 [Naumovozyma dairenensis CBS 421]|uniref:Guanine nucleotide-binding protein alpha-2 subunit n=1 Tax=Naumovozyma dairenensis (strain ATCC 10597 / BCRC 20456 / CBS 421 / NBRC 0211 / NRRL Y-12639) TaxID=1071378 RepID=G0WGL3_NAUDC|nr:hypothetical protein NDAI_0J00490 [Naumovozyma dairenensis CBS 421]CCD26941.1 hypothetical protein NDAI_0J00490 [Naumovozyma dairenensis CBS 421]